MIKVDHDFAQRHPEQKYYFYRSEKNIPKEPKQNMRVSSR